MPVPAVYLDECIDVRLAEALHQRGFIAVTSLTTGMLGSTDEDQLMYATTHGLMLVMHNRRHFRRLHRLLQEQRRSQGGIILLSRTTTLPRLTMHVTMMLDWIATLDDHRDRLFTWGALQGLFDRGYRLTDYSEQDVRFAIGR